MAEPKPDGAQNAGGDAGTPTKPGQSTPDKLSTPQTGEFSRDDIDKAHSKGMGLGVDRGKKEAVADLLKDLGVEDLEGLKSVMAKGAKALADQDKTKTTAEKAMDALKAGYEQERADRERERAEDRKVLDVATEFIQEEKEKRLFEELKVEDTNLLKAFMLLHPAQDGESQVDHAKRVIEMRPEITQAGATPPDPSRVTLGGGAVTPTPSTRIKELGEMIHSVRQKPTRPQPKRE